MKIPHFIHIPAKAAFITIWAIFCAQAAFKTPLLQAQPPKASYYLVPRHAEDIPLKRFQERRARVLATMSPKSLAVLFAAYKRSRQNDVDYEYRQHSDFLYLCGFPEPKAALMLIPGGIVLPKNLDSTFVRHEALLFVQKQDLYAEMREGSITGASRASSLYGIKALDQEHFASVLALALALQDSSQQNAAQQNAAQQNASQKRDTLFLTTQPTNTVVEPFSGELVSFERETSLRLQKAYPQVVIRSQKRLLGEMRQIKDTDELKILRKAIDISMAGHRAAMSIIKPDVFEYEAEAAMESAFKRLGAEDVGYPSIVGAGANSCILHYTASRKQAKSGEVMLLDCGAELLGYTADITRTVPVNGKFSAEQREIYNLVYAAQEAAIKEYRKGVDWRLPHSRAVDVIRTGLLKLGIITNPDDYKLYFPHGSVHYIGLDVHDAGSYATFQPNMIFTCEPGIYIPEGSDCDKKWWNIGVRIEDDILITESGEPLNLSASLPRKLEDVEAAMTAANARKKR